MKKNNTLTESIYKALKESENVGELLQQCLDICTKHDYGYKKNDDNSYHLNKYSNAGEDFGFDIECKGETDVEQAKCFINDMYDYAENFDVDEHVAMWVEARANGDDSVPTATELVDDAREIEEDLTELSEDLLKYKRETKSLNESFWNRGKYAQIFLDEYLNIDTEKWNNATQEERDEMVRPHCVEFWNKYGNEMREQGVVEDFLDDLEDSNFHTECKILRDLYVNEGKSAKNESKRLRRGKALKEDVEYFNFKNQHNTSVKELKVDYGKKQFEVGSFTMTGGKTLKRKDFYDKIEELKKCGFTEVKQSNDDNLDENVIIDTGSTNIVSDETGVTISDNGNSITSGNGVNIQIDNEDDVIPDEDMPIEDDEIDDSMLDEPVEDTIDTDEENTDSIDTTSTEDEYFDNSDTFVEDSMDIINPEDKDYYDGELVRVSVPYGAGVEGYSVVMYGNIRNTEDILNNFVAYAEKDERGKGVLYTEEDIDGSYRDEDGDVVDHIYIDATSEGASRPYYLDSQVTVEPVDKLQEDDNRGFKELARCLFVSLQKSDDGKYVVWNDGNFVERIYAKDDEEAIAKFNEKYPKSKNDLNEDSMGQTVEIYQNPEFDYKITDITELDNKDSGDIRAVDMQNILNDLDESLTERYGTENWGLLNPYLTRKGKHHKTNESYCSAITDICIPASNGKAELNTVLSFEVFGNGLIKECVVKETRTNKKIDRFCGKTKNPTKFLESVIVDLINNRTNDKNIKNYRMTESDEEKLTDEEIKSKIEEEFKRNDCIDINKIAKFLKESTEYLYKEDYEGCFRYKLSNSSFDNFFNVLNDVAIFVGWGGDFDENDEDVLHSKKYPNYAVCTAVKINNDFAWASFEELDLPYDKESGEVVCEDYSVKPNEDYEQLAKELILDLRNTIWGTYLGTCVSSLDGNSYYNESEKVTKSKLNEIGANGTVKGGAKLRKLINKVDVFDRDSINAFFEQLDICINEAKGLTDDEYYVDKLDDLKDEIEWTRGLEDISEFRLDTLLDDFYDICDSIDVFVSIVENAEHKTKRTYLKEKEEIGLLDDDTNTEKSDIDDSDELLDVEDELDEDVSGVAVFHRKPASVEAMRQAEANGFTVNKSNYKIVGTEELSAKDFNDFAKHLSSKEYDWLQKYNDLGSDTGMFTCVEVTNKDDDSYSLLVDTEGYDYARYVAINDNPEGKEEEELIDDNPDSTDEENLDEG